MLLLGLAMALESADVQTRLVRTILGKVEGSLGGKIRYSKLIIKPFNTFVIKDLALIDNLPQPDPATDGQSSLDTLISARSLSGRFSLLGLFNQQGVYLSRVEMKQGMLCMTSEKDEWGSNLNRFFHTHPSSKDPVAGPELFNIRKLNVDGFRFRFLNLASAPKKYNGIGFNWTDLDLKAGSLKGRHVHFGGGKLSFTIDHIDVTDKCGYSAGHISGKSVCGMGQVLIDDLILQDGHSDISLPKFSMNFRNSSSFRDFVNEVRMDGMLGATTLHGWTLRYIFDALPDNISCLKFESGAKVTGYVNDLNVSKLRFTEKSGTKADISCHLTGLTDMPHMLMTADVKSLDFTTKSLTALVKSIVPSSNIDITKLADGSRFRFSGHASGPINRLSVQGRLSSKDGYLATNVSIRNLADKNHVTEISGHANAEDFDLGAILNSNALGECTMHTGFRARMVPGEPSVILDSLLVGKLGALGYDYSGIKAAGKLTGKSFDGKVICNDPNLNFLFQGICDFSKTTQNAIYKFYANLGYANLDALHLDKRGIGSKASCRIIANYKRIVRGDGIGIFKIEDIILEDDKDVHDVGDITIKATNDSDVYSISLDSKFASCRFKGAGSIPELLDDLQEITLRRHIPALYANCKAPDGNGQYDIDLDFHDSRTLLSFIKPGLYIADSTSFRMRVTPDGLVKGSVISPRLAYGTNYIKGSSIEFDNAGGSLAAIIENKEISMAGIKAHKSTILADASDNEVAVGIHFNEEEDAANYAEIFVNADFERDNNDTLAITVRPLQSNFKLGDKLWETDSSRVLIRGGMIDVDGFRISHGDQEITINGKYSDNEGDSLVLNIVNLGLSVLGDASGKPLDIPGIIEGQARLVSGKDKKLSLDMICDSARVKGSFVPSTGLLDLDAKLSRTSLAIAEPFLKGLASNISGTIDGEIKLNGNIRNAEIKSSNINLNNASFTLDGTGASYILNGPMTIQNDGISMNDVAISDGKGGSGTISGGLLFNHLQQMTLGMRVKLDNLNAINIPTETGNGIYGNLDANADLVITGPLDNIRIDGNVSTSGKGQIHVPLNTAVATSGSDLLTFKEKEFTGYIDPYEEMIKSTPVVKDTRKGNITLHLHANANPDVTAFMELNKSTGNVITASGTASVLLDLQTAKGDMNLAGEYMINSGNLHFELPGIVKKEFNLTNGSSLHFNGPIKNSRLDITAVYKLKTSLSTLLSDTTSVSTRRPVECSIRISDKITSPKIEFGVNVPDLDPSSRAKMTEALNTEDKVQKQFIALLVMGTFLPSESSGVFNSANILYSNVSEIMSNQLNNILRKLDIPLDLGLGYQQNQGGTDIFDVAISTQLFNNRVEIGGTVGNRQYRTSKNPYGDVVGDIDISIKLDKSGMFKLNLFSHSADEFSSFLDYSQRNGLGIAYQKEYDNFFKMIKDMLTPKSKRESREEVPVEKPTKTVTIEQ